jgi:ribosomal protein S18 acetylase RimI-like enzyme
MTPCPPAAISILSADELASEISDLGKLLHDCVHAGAGVSFVLPFGQADAEAFWREKILPAARNQKLLVVAARRDGRIAGAVQLDYDTPPNQPHRAEIRKLLVHPDFRRRGIARAMLVELERQAKALGRSLITLDTRTGDKAEPLYASLGYITVGVIPRYALDSIADRLDPTTIMYKEL